jgi:uncharacterized protein (DUF2147 family)
MNQLFARIGFVFTVLLFATQMQAQSVIGKWKTIDDETMKPKSVVEIYEKDGKIYGKIVKLFREPEEEQNPVCTACTGKLKGQPIIGMQIINGLEKDGEEYEDGTIFDPSKDKTYNCKIWLENDDTLAVRGYVMMFFRTQTWERYTEDI